jgi:hypothetical protein
VGGEGTDARRSCRRRPSSRTGSGARTGLLRREARTRACVGAPRRPALPPRRREFALFESAGAPSGQHTQLAFEVEDIEAVVAELRRRGVVFESYDFPGLTTVDGIVDIDGNYPSKGTGERGAWFRDSEGNLLGIGQPVA